MHASGAELPSARNIPSRYAPPAKGRKGCKGRKPQVSFPCAADIQISPKAKQETLHACQSEAEPQTDKHVEFLASLSAIFECPQHKGRTPAVSFPCIPFFPWPAARIGPRLFRSAAERP